MRKSSIGACLLVVGAMLTLPIVGSAQQAALEATLIGTVRDTTGAVLPGVTITAVHEATGNTFEGVTDALGVYRIPVRVGVYRVTAQLPSFRTVIRTGLEVLVGQEVIADVQMQVSALEESVTVSGEAPLIDVTSSTVGANIDPRQVQELPLNGRNWMDLTLLAPGARRNEAGGFVQNRQGYAMTNLDGQQVLANYHSGGDNEQPQYSRDAIAEFEVIANRFDATQGRSAGMMVNAISKSGTNTLAGTFGGYFRHDKFNAKDFFRDEVLPFQNQQVSTTLGGPIVRDRVHFFGNYEYERQPQTFVYTSPYPFFNIDQQFTNRVHRYLGRGDVQFTPKARLSVRAVGSDNLFYSGGGATNHPSVDGPRTRATDEVFATFTQVLSNRSVNEIKGGWMGFDRTDHQIGRWKGGPFPHRPVGEGGSVRVQLPGYNIGAGPLFVFLDTAQLRDDFTTSFTGAGRHDVRLGGEYMRFANRIGWCLRCDGEIDARTPGARVPANIQELFPVWNDASTWNTAPLAPITRWVTHSVSDTGFYQEHVRHVVGAWFQDNWQASDRLTLNLGVRYDVDSNAHSEKLRFLPWLPGNLPHDTNNVAPRVGFAYSLNDRTVLRGGYGLFFAFAPNDGVHQSLGYCCVRFEWQIFNDGRPDFTAGAEPNQGWFNGPKPTMAAALANACDVNFVPGCAHRSLEQEINYPGRQTSYSHQAGVGIQRQLGNDMSFEANYVYTGGRLEEDAPNVNLTFNPATGGNYRFTDVSRRAFPQWGQVNFELLEGWSNYHAGDFTFTKRFSDRWQATASYTLAYFRDAVPSPDQWFIGDDGVVARRPVGFALARDLGGEYTLAATDQRHRATFNGIWDIGYGVQFSGLYFFGSGERFSTNVGRDIRDSAGASRDRRRLRQDGTIQPRNAVVGDPLHRVDLRLQKRLSLGGRRTIDGIFEVFNLFNHENYGSYVTNEANAQYGQPQFNAALAYYPRMLQLGFRFAF